MMLRPCAPCPTILRPATAWALLATPYAPTGRGGPDHLMLWRPRPGPRAKSCPGRTGRTGIGTSRRPRGRPRPGPCAKLCPGRTGPRRRGTALRSARARPRPRPLYADRSGGLGRRAAQGDGTEPVWTQAASAATYALTGLACVRVGPSGLRTRSGHGLPSAPEAVRGATAAHGAADATGAPLAQMRMSEPPWQLGQRRLGRLPAAGPLRAQMRRPRWAGVPADLPGCPSWP